MLKIAAERMSATLRATDIVARFGGDEFVVLLDGADADTARDVARKLNQALAEPYPGILSSVTASIGIACFPQDGRHLERCSRRPTARCTRPRRPGATATKWPLRPAGRQPHGAAAAGRPVLDRKRLRPTQGAATHRARVPAHARDAVAVLAMALAGVDRPVRRRGAFNASLRGIPLLRAHVPARPRRADPVRHADK